MNYGVSYKQMNLNGGTPVSFGAKLIADELEFYLTMPKYSLFFGNEMGLDLEKYLFLPNKTATFHLIKSEIENALSNYNKVILQEITMVFEETKLIIDLRVLVKSTGESFTLPLLLEM